MFLRRYLTLFLFLFLTINSFCQTSNWTSFVDSVKTFSSPRSVELTGDTILDIVMGGGVEGQPGNFGVIAFNGLDGSILWNVHTNDEVFGSAAFEDITGDSISDVFIGGRYAVFVAINGATGQKIWEFFPYPHSVNPNDSGWYQFYTPQLIPDQNNDGFNDVLVTNGGDPTALPWDTNRPPGHILILDALTGNILADAEAPDGKEIYSSPVVVDFKNNGTYQVVFGTGGETIGGGLWSADLQDIMLNDISNANLLAMDTAKGFIAPASVTDLNNDGYFDIVSQSFGGTIHAINGATQSPLWSLTIPGTESSSQPTIGNFIGDLTPDVFNVLYKGTAPTFTDFYQVMINGQTGQIEWMDSISDLHFASSVAFDYNSDGRDEVFMSTNDFVGTHFEHRLKIIDFTSFTSSVISSEAGVGLACTPLLNDIDKNGEVDLLYAIRKDSVNISGTLGFYLKSFNLQVDTSCTGIAWGSYMSSFYDGYYISPGQQCNNLTISYLKTNPSCNGFSDGSIFLTPSGSTAPYTYYWENGSTADSLTGLAAGLYNVTIMDASCCVKTETYLLNDPYVISINAVHNPCEGDSIGMATVASSGCPCMTSGCVFGWSNGDSTKTATGLGAGMHYITIVHADGCIVVDSVEILAPVIIDSSVVTQIKCGGEYGEILLFPQDSTNTFYNWSNGATGPHLDSLGPGNYTVYLQNNVPCYDTLEFTIDSSAFDTLSIHLDSILDITCYGDSNGLIEIFTTGGVPTYSYSWSSGGNVGDTTLSNLTAGTYTVTCTDSNGCIDIENYHIIEPLEIIGLFTSNTGLCGGNGNASVLITGGTPPYSYAWDDANQQTTSSAANLQPDTYTIVVTDSNGCTINITDTVDGTNPVTCNIGSNNPSSCGGTNGTAYVTVITGTSPFAYSWSDSLSQITDTAFGLAAGSYQVTILDFVGCDTTITVTLVDPNAPLLQITDSLQVTCKNENTGSATVTGFGGTPPFYYSWNTVPVQSNAQATGLGAGIYSVLVTDNAGCSSSITTTIVEPDSLFSISLASTTSIGIAGGSDGAIDITTIGGLTPYTYYWLPGGQVTQDIIGLSYGTYQVEVIDANGCIDSLEVTLNDGPVGIDKTKDIELLFSIFPNPNNGIFELVFNQDFESEINLEVYNCIGQVLFKSDYDAYDLRERILIDLANTENGIYFMKITSDVGIYSEKIIIY